jgi:hypothetical protein
MSGSARRSAVTLALGVALVAPAAHRAQADEVGGKALRDYPVQPVPFTAVRFSDAFWRPRIDVNHTVTIPFAFEKCEETKRVYHFERAAAVLRGAPLEDKSPPGYPFDDTDVYKVIEGASTGSTIPAAGSAACLRPGGSSTGTARSGSRSRAPDPTASRRTGTTGSPSSR